MHLKVITPKKLAFEKDIESITIPTAAGEITILPKHVELLTLLKEGVITIRSAKEEEYLSIGGGYMETDGKNIHILVSRAYNQDEINEKRTEEALEKAKKVLAETKDKHERNEALSTMRRSILDMKLLGKMRRKKSS
ncbi:MAG: ATP synthase F1 subunit epsilon [bacterium]|nr:ATP synthase F1 subunit epsilon [bacterium]